MDFFHQDVADMPAVDGAVLQGNRAHADEADMSDLDSNRAAAPGFSPVPFDSPFGSSTSSLMSGFTDTIEALMPFWPTECTDFSGLDYIFPCPFQMDPSIALDLPLLSAFDAGSATNPVKAETLLQASQSPPEVTLTISPFLPLSLCHPVSSEQPGDGSMVAGSTSLDPPPTYPPPTPSPPPYDDIQDGDSPTSLDRLRHILRQYYQNRKPPGKIFKSFISRRGATFQCTLCTYKIGNREQINQHIMKVHCSHFPFKCSFAGCVHRDVRRADMNKHQEKHEPAKWGCEHCGRRVQNERNLRRHIANKHPEVRPAPRPRHKPSRRTNRP